MTKEEVAQVIAYCDENKISYKQRLSELGISPWNFYDAKRKYAPREEEENAGEFLQLIPGGSFLPNPIKPSRSRSSKQKESAQETVAVNIELRTPTGTSWVTSERMKSTIKKLTFVPKTANIIGLQIADLVAYPIACHILRPDVPNPAFDILRKNINLSEGKELGLKVIK